MIDMEGARLQPAHNRHATVTLISRTLIILLGCPVFLIWLQVAGFAADCRLRIQVGLLPKTIASGPTQRRAEPAPAASLPSQHRPGSSCRICRHPVMPSTMRRPTREVQSPLAPVFVLCERR